MPQKKLLLAKKCLIYICFINTKPNKWKKYKLDSTDHHVINRNNTGSLC